MSKSQIVSGSTPNIGTFLSVLPASAAVLLEKSTVNGKSAAYEEMLRVARENAEREGYLKGFQQGTAEGYQAGFHQAENDGRVKVDRMVAQFMDALVNVVQRTESAIPEWFRSAEDQLALLAMTIVKRILEAELKIDRSSALTIAKNAIGSIGHSERIRIRLNPFDLPILEQHKQELLAASANVRSIEFVDDASIQGGCIVESTGGLVDASLDSRLRVMEQEVEAEFKDAA